MRFKPAAHDQIMESFRVQETENKEIKPKNVAQRSLVPVPSPVELKVSDSDEDLAFL